MKKRILCFGDSNTWGYIAGDGGRYPEDVRWTGVMRRALGEDFEVIEEGYNGRTTVFDDPVEGRLSGIRYFGACLDSQSPLDLVVLMLGTNDLKMRFGVDAWTIAFGFNRYLDALRITPMAGERPKVLLAAPILLGEAYKRDPLMHGMMGDRGVERSLEFTPAYRDFAETAGIEFIDASLYGSASDADGLHMAPADHARLGAAMAERVKKILG